MRVQNIQTLTNNNQTKQKRNNTQSFSGFTGKSLIGIITHNEADFKPNLIIRLTRDIKALPDNVGVDLVTTSIPDEGYDLYLRNTNYPKAFEGNYPGSIWRSYKDDLTYAPKPSDALKPETLPKLINEICNLLENPAEVAKGLLGVRKNHDQKIATKNEYAKFMEYAKANKAKLDLIKNVNLYGSNRTITGKIKESQMYSEEGIERYNLIRANFTDNLDKILSLPPHRYEYRFFTDLNSFSITNSQTGKVVEIDCIPTPNNTKKMNLSMEPKEFAEGLEKMIKGIDETFRPDAKATALTSTPVTTTKEEQPSSIFASFRNWFYNHKNEKAQAQIAIKRAKQQEAGKIITKQLQALQQDKTLVAKANKLTLLDKENNPISFTKWIEKISKEISEGHSTKINQNFTQNFRYVLDSDINAQKFITRWQIENGQIELEKTFTNSDRNSTVSYYPILDLSQPPEKFQENFDNKQREFLRELAERKIINDEVLDLQVLVRSTLEE